MSARSRLTRTAVFATGVTLLVASLGVPSTHAVGHDPAASEPSPPATLTADTTSGLSGSPAATISQVPAPASAVTSEARTATDGVASTANVTPASTGNPFGSFDTVAVSSPLRLTAAGWAIDPDTVNPIRVSITVDGAQYRRVIADRSRPDVARAHPQFGPLHGFEVSLDALSPGKHRVCVTAENTGTGTNQQLGCKEVFKFTGSSNPLGNVDLARQNVPRTIQVAGWTVDPDTKAALDVHVYVNGRFAKAGKADVARGDIGRTYPGYGNRHGFSIEVMTPAGNHRVCVYAINAGAGNVNPELGCRQVQVRGGNPFGNFEAFTTTQVNGTTRLVAAGWAIDPDVADPIDVHVYVDGEWYGSRKANVARPDVGRAYPGYGDRHGFLVPIEGLAAGVRNVCIYAINAGPGNANPLLACRNVRV